MWLAWLSLVIGLVGISGNLRDLSIGFWRGLCKVIASPDPLAIQLADVVDGLGRHLSYPLYQNPDRCPRVFIAMTVPLTTWLTHPSWGVDSYRRHLQAWRENGMRFPPAWPKSVPSMCPIE